MKTLLKWTVRFVALLLVFPAACLALFGRFQSGFSFFSQAFALVPGLPGSYLRVAWYSLTLQHSGLSNQIGLGSFFSHSRAAMGEGISIGAWCVMGQVSIGDRTQIACGVQILSGSQQHMRDAEGRLTDEGRVFRQIKVGTDCWLGAAAIVMADLGDGVTVASACVVTKDVPLGAVVAGNPARVLRSATDGIPFF